MSKTLPKPIPIVLRHHQLTIGREKKQPDFEDKTINNGAIMLMIVYDGFSMDFQLSRTKITTWESTRRRPFMEPKWEPQNPPSGTALKVGRPGVSNCMRKSWYFKLFKCFMIYVYHQ
jgi:hypothetical protein